METDQRVAVVSGASRGLGRAIAVELGRQSVQVVLTARSEDDLRETAEEIESHSGRALPVAGDVTDPDDIRGVIEATQRRFSRLDILVNNAGVIGPPAFLEDADRTSWQRTLDVNLTGPFHLIRAAVPLMARQNGGKIINIVSGLGQMAFPRFCAYAVSKAGLIQMTRSLAAELRPLGIQVNAIDPGIMDTKMQEEIRGLDPEKLGPEVHRQFVEYHEKKHLKPPHAVAPLAAFLASPESGRLTGEIGTLSHYRRRGWPG